MAALHSWIGLGVSPQFWPSSDFLFYLAVVDGDVIVEHFPPLVLDFNPLAY